MSHFHDALGLEISCACAAAALFFDFLTPDDIWAPRGRARRGPFQERASCLLWPQQATQQGEKAVEHLRGYSLPSLHDTLHALG